MSNKTERKKPTHTIWQVVGERDKARWIRIGAGWTNRDNKGINLVFDSYPALGHVVIREVSVEDSDQGAAT